MAKCLEIIQALESNGQTFNLKIKSGDFSFSLDTRGATSKVEKRKKKLSPSQQRRNLKRKEEFLKRKSENSQENSVAKDKEKEENAKTPQLHKCTLCEKVFSTENGMNIHKGKAHDTERLRSLSSKVSPLKVSPLKVPPREEQCECCGDTMSPQHQCEPPQKSTPPSKCEIFCTCNACLPFPCEHCNKRSSSTEMLEKHKAKEHFNWISW